MENNNRNVLIGILAGAAVGAAIGYYFAQRKDHETGRHIRESIWTGITEVAFAKGIEVISELMKKYSETPERENAREHSAAA